MSYVGSADDQSEDGELRHSPTDGKMNQEEILDFSLSEEDVDTADSLDIKPPQVNRLPHGSSTSSRNKRKERSREGRNRHGRTERHREDRSHGHRDKHHRDRSGRERSRSEYHRDYHKELYRYQETHSSASSSMQTYKEAKYLEYRRTDELTPQTMRYERKYEEKRLKEQERHEKHERYEKEMRYESEKSRRYEEKRQKSTGDQALDDLRERLLDKKRLKDSDKESRRRLRSGEHLESTSAMSTVALEQDAELYVKEIIDLSGTSDDLIGRERKERHHKREEREEKIDWDREEFLDKKVLDAESEAQELRKEKLLQADREIARQKEQYKLERERRHQRRLERQAKRRMQEQQEHQEQLQRKRQRMSGELGQYKDKDLSIVTVSDTSSHSSHSTESEHSDSAGQSSRSSSSELDRDQQDEEDENERSAGESTSGEDHRDIEREVDEQQDGSDRRNRDQSTSRSRSKSSSPKSNGQLNQKPEESELIKSSEPEVEATVKKLDEGLPPYFPAIQGCRSVEEFQCLNRIEEGTYGVVYRARDKRTEEIVALKRLKMEKEKEGFPITSLREINTLLKGQHPNIVTVREIVVGSNMDKIFIVMDYVEHDLKSLMETMRNRRQVFVPGEVKCLLRQLLGAVAHLHDNWILHRDLKTSNLLLSHKGILKVGDFGLAREYGSPLKAYTPIVVTLWYRAPELLLCCKEYSTPIDMWSVGCIFAELVTMNVLFPGKSEIDQLNRIFKTLGTPNERIWPGYNELPAVKKMKFAEYPASSLRQSFNMLSRLGLMLLQRLLTYDPAQRSTAEDALSHPYFTEQPLPIDPAMFPTWPAKSELGHRKALAASPKPPSGGREYKQLGDGDENSALGFHMGGTSSASTLLENRRLQMGAGFSLKF